MLSLTGLARTVLVSALFVVACAAQHLKASATYDNGTTASFTLTNFDTANSGGGNIFVLNGTPVSIYIEWTRDTATGVVTITINGGVSSWLNDADQNSNGGKSTLNSSPASAGSWNRT